MNEQRDQLLARVLDLFAARFGRHAVLRGGMVLRILGSPRFTNDADYVFVPYASKRAIVDDIVECLRQIEGASVSHSLNSKCLRIVLAVDRTTIQIEASVAMTAQTALASTRLFSRQFNLPPRMVCVTDHAVALANKLAAWNERRLMRDLYDVWYFLQMGILPDTGTLEARLQKPVYSRLVKAADRFKGDTTAEFYEFIRDYAATLSDESIRAELADYLPLEDCEGLAIQIRAALVKLR